MSRERPILFSSPMVRAVLDGSKTQTRRIVKGQVPEWATFTDEEDVKGSEFFIVCGEKEPSGLRPILTSATCPYGQPGDRLWVRETHRAIWGQSPGYLIGVDYKADPQEKWERMRDHMGRPKWTPSIHMFREHSRILLEIVNVRVERLNDCGEADAKAEGVMQLDDDNSRPETRTKEGWSVCPTCAGTGLRSTLGAGGGVNFDVDCADCDTHLKLYRHLWESINGAGSWAANPWVWRVEFSRVKP